ncbi:hypothetical protein OE810_02010 [Rhodobacteraceae bacterium XHP0102]|nr:hypothetical protein [Rhodobacteraceae bacterium XHP0102]
MKHMGFGAVAFGIWLITTAPVAAQDAKLTLDMCLSDRISGRIETEAQLLDCVAEALAPCQAEPDDMHAVATLCFRNSRSAFDAGISAAMTRLRAGQDNALITLLSIETKYDMLSGLLQCDRMEELALALSNIGPDAIARQKAQCQATTSALVLARLTLRSEGEE